MRRWPRHRRRITGILVMLSAVIAICAIFWRNITTEDPFPATLTPELLQSWCKGNCNPQDFKYDQDGFIVFDSEGTVVFEVPEGRDRQLSVVAIFTVHLPNGLTGNSSIIVGMCGDGMIKPPTEQELEIRHPPEVTFSRQVIFSVVPADRLTRHCEPAPPPSRY